MKAPVRIGASEHHLLTGLAQVEGTSLPTGGENTRCLIAGHRGMRNGIMFGGLGKVQAGDSVLLTTKGEVLEYVVTDIEIIRPEEWDKVIPQEGRDILSLITCDPLLPPRNKRLLVNCDRVQEEKDLPETKVVKRKTETYRKPSLRQSFEKQCDVVTGFLGLFVLGATIQVVRIFKEEKDS